MRPSQQRPQASLRATTIVEVLASALLIFLGLGAVFAMNTESLQILRKTRQCATSSQIVQERIESLRTRPWPEITRGEPLSSLLQTPAISAPDLADADPAECITVSVPETPGATTKNSAVLEVQKTNGTVKITQDADFSAGPLLLFEVSITWRQAHGTQQRKVRAIIARTGLTRCGVFGTSLGRPQHTASTTQ